MKQKQEPRQRPEADDEVDDLLGEASAGHPAAAESEGWKGQAYTQVVRRTCMKRYVGLLKELAKVATTSSDPRVAFRGGQLQELQVEIITLGGKI